MFHRHITFDFKYNAFYFHYDHQYLLGECISGSDDPQYPSPPVIACSQQLSSLSWILCACAGPEDNNLQPANISCSIPLSPHFTFYIIG